MWEWPVLSTDRFFSRGPWRSHRHPWDHSRGKGKMSNLCASPRRKPSRNLFFCVRRGASYHLSLCSSSLLVSLSCIKSFSVKNLWLQGGRSGGLYPERILKLVYNHNGVSGYLVDLHVPPPPPMISAADCLWVPTRITFEGSFVSFLPGESHFHWTMLSALGSWLYPFIFWCHRDVVICFIFSNMPVTSLTYEDVRSQRCSCSPHNLTVVGGSRVLTLQEPWVQALVGESGIQRARAWPKQRFFQLPWWLRRWRVCLQCGRPRFDPWVGEIPWGREWQPTPSFLPEEFHGGILAGCSSQGHKA